MHLAPSTFARPLAVVAVVIAASLPATRGDVLHVEEPAALTEAVLKARPGDEVVIKEGVWREVHVRIVGNGISNSPANGYQPARHALVQDNHVIGCRDSLVIGYADKDSFSSVVVPEDCIIRGNAFLADADRIAIIEHQAARETQWESNVATGQSPGIDDPAGGGLRFHPGAPSADRVPPVPELKFSQSAGPSWDREKKR